MSLASNEKMIIVDGDGLCLMGACLASEGYDDYNDQSAKRSLFHQLLATVLEHFAMFQDLGVTDQDIVVARDNINTAWMAPGVLPEVMVLALALLRRRPVCGHPPDTYLLSNAPPHDVVPDQLTAAEKLRDPIRVLCRLGHHFDGVGPVREGASTGLLASDPPRLSVSSRPHSASRLPRRCFPASPTICLQTKSGGEHGTQTSKARLSISSQVIAVPLLTRWDV